MKQILMVEPSFYGVSFAEAGKKLGHRVIALVSDANNPRKYGYEDFCDDLIVCDIRDATSMLAAIQASPYAGRIDALLSATDYASAETARVAETLGLYGLSYRAAVLARNKDLARGVYRQKGVPSAKYAVVRTWSEAIEGSKKIGYPVVLKPTNTASSQNVYFVRDEVELAHAFSILRRFKTSYMDFPVREEYLVEEYLEGQEFSVEIFVNESSVVFAEVTEKITTPTPYFVEKFHVFPTSVYKNRKREIISVAKQALDAIGLINGPAHVEVKLTEDGPKIIEVNGRPGGDHITSDLIKNAYGVDIFRETIQLYLGEPVVFDVHTHLSSAIGFILSDKDRKNVYLNGVDEALSEDGIVRYEIEHRTFSAVNQARSSDDRLGYIIVQDNTPERAKETIMNIISKITIQSNG